MGNRIESQSPAVEEDGGLKVLEAAESTGCLFDGLDLRVELLGDGIRDAVHEIGQHVVQLPSNVLCGLNHRFEARMRCPAIPGFPVDEGFLASG